MATSYASDVQFNKANRIVDRSELDGGQCVDSLALFSCEFTLNSSCLFDSASLFISRLLFLHESLLSLSGN